MSLPSWLCAAVARQRELVCEAMIDQRRYIGTDPVGYKCGNVASGEVAFEGRNDLKPVRVCDRCRAMLESEPERVTFIVTIVKGD